ncbi:MAG: hypothetical protein M1834_007206 [Cirrosporium novae-zelandiae]|nr:MAG: hypothetical protein M1834_007206 [Cirrosporium novae-zelandiae]
MSATKQLRKAARIILVGAPGVGKGTQTERLIKKFPQLSAVSSGDLLRENVRRGTPLGLKAEATMKAGSLVPDAMILQLIVSELSSQGWLSPSTTNVDALLASTFSFVNKPTAPSDDPLSSFILDGFPRNVNQASLLDRLVPINCVVNLVTPPSIILHRIANRWIHAPSGRVYNSDFNVPRVPGKDDITGEPLIKRDDDNVETFKARLKTFDETSRPLLEHYEKMGVLWKIEGNSSDEISPKLFQELEKRFG